jgi:HK97 family phage prohead protease
MQTQLETRTLAAPIEVRKADNKKMAAGYAALFNSETDIGGYFREVIAPGAFSGAKDSDVRALVDHNSGRVIGRTTAGTLRLSEDTKGLAVEIDLPDTTDGRDLAVSMERGDITGMSFGFRVTKEQWDESTSPPLRTIMAVDLFEVSAVAFPAYEDTQVALRSLDDARKAAEIAARTERRENKERRLAMKAQADLIARGHSPKSPPA